MRLLTRRTLWLSAALLMAVVVVGVGVWFLASRSRITQANFNRIQEEMAWQEVDTIIGEPDRTLGYFIEHERYELCQSYWCSGPNRIVVKFETNKVHGKEIHLATTWETVTWYAKRGAAQIGIRWP